MIVPVLIGPLLIALIAVLSGAFTRGRGRSVARLADDPALPERVVANRSPNGVVLGFCIAILILNARSHFVWAVPLLIVTRMAAAYPLRKILYCETWSLGGFLSFFLRLVTTTDWSGTKARQRATPLTTAT